MPGGVPVASMAIGKAGAKNAALFAARILAIENKGIGAKLSAYKKKMSRDVEKKQENIACRKS
jgi:phosphoribosylcarboxyaminoimidazole (NCAIR) mutase